MRYKIHVYLTETRRLSQQIVKRNRPCAANPASTYPAQADVSEGKAGRITHPRDFSLGGIPCPKSASVH